MACCQCNKNKRIHLSDTIKFRGIQGQRGAGFRVLFEILVMRRNTASSCTTLQSSVQLQKHGRQGPNSLAILYRPLVHPIWRCVIVICDDVSKTFIKTTTRVEDDLTEIIRLTVLATAKQKHPAVSSIMFTTCQACLRAVGGHLQHVLQHAAAVSHVLGHIRIHSVGSL